MKPSITVIQPPALAARPQFKGMPIPYNVEIDASGVPDFRVTNPERWRECVTKGKCGLCGQPRGKVLWLLGGPLCAVNRLFFDPPMHLACLLYAVQVCPFIAMGKGYAEYAKVQARHEGGVRESSQSSAEPPDTFYIFGARCYTLVRLNGEVLVKLPSGDRNVLTIEVPKDKSTPQFQRWLASIPAVEQAFVEKRGTLLLFGAES